MDRKLSKDVIRARKLRTIAKVTVPLAAVVILLVWIIGSLGKSVRAVDLATSVVEKGLVDVSYPASGTVAPSLEEVINSPISSRILEVYHIVGDEVEAGEPILKLDLQSAEADLKKSESEAEIKRLEIEQHKLAISTEIGDIKMQIEVAKMRLNRLEVELRNEQYLDSLGSGTTERVREVEFSCRTGRLELQQLEEKYASRKQATQAALAVEQLQYEILCRSLEATRRTFQDAKICAPRKGVITFVNTEIGATVGRDTKIAALADLGHFKAECSISDLYAPHISVGTRCTLTSMGRSIGGIVTNISPLSNNGSLNFTVVPDNDADEILRPGLKMDVRVTGDQKMDVLRISNGSYYTKPGTYTLFVVEDKVLKRRELILGEGGKEWVEVLRGLSEGEIVVTSDMESYKNNNKLKIK